MRVSNAQTSYRNHSRGFTSGYPMRAAPRRDTLSLSSIKLNREKKGRSEVAFHLNLATEGAPGVTTEENIAVLPAGVV